MHRPDKCLGLSGLTWLAAIGRKTFGDIWGSSLMTVGNLGDESWDFNVVAPGFAGTGGGGELTFEMPNPL